MGEDLISRFSELKSSQPQEWAVLTPHPILPSPRQHNRGCLRERGAGLSAGVWSCVEGQGWLFWATGMRGWSQSFVLLSHHTEVHAHHPGCLRISQQPRLPPPGMATWGLDKG